MTNRKLPGVSPTLGSTVRLDLLWPTRGCRVPGFLLPWPSDARAGVLGCLLPVACNPRRDVEPTAAAKRWGDGHR